MRQAKRNKETSQSPELPVVINRKNRMKTGDSLLLISLDDFLVFYKSYLEIEGIIDGDSQMSEVQQEETD